MGLIQKKFDHQIADLKVDDFSTAKVVKPHTINNVKFLLLVVELDI
ncbi:hypothetical protein C900_01646 [Fulvivirga imtechensis AK7]|uniref:Uncharacterized protein n=1 Tax=Fulvivirga imtechensis AK7 TaxID=1237149 RepID=L8JXL1_9BACT|nr:hypothetical protein C900_01646 [Fulvivirga imtechensis AK7]